MLTNIIGEYLSGKSQKEIAELNHCSATKIRNFLIKNNIPIRNKGKVGLYPILSENEKQIIYGTILGDSCLSTQRKTFHMDMTQGGRQEEYAKWKSEQLKVLEPKFYKYNRFDKRTNKIYVKINIHTKSHPIFNEIQQEIYLNGSKQPTFKYLDRLSPLAIAVWYCDDGSLYQNKDTNLLTLAIHSFKDKQMIINFFRLKYNLDFYLNGGSIRLVNKKEIKKFFALFGDFIPNSMKYKKDFVDYKIYKGRDYAKR